VTAVVVVENPARWPIRLKGAELVAAKDYLTGPRFAEARGLRVFNLCRTYGYQTLGYYVSLLAAARRHRPLPSVETLQDLRLSPVVRIASEELEAQIQRTLKPLRRDRFELSIYFGRNFARRYDPLCRALFDQFPAPFLRAQFSCERKRWELRGVRLIAANEVPESHHEFVMKSAAEYFGRPRRRRSSPRSYRYDLAILVDPEAEDAPSDEGALRRFERAAREHGIDATRIGREDAARVATFDALFIRETTAVDHYTYRFARRAAAEGLVVIDDPVSILRCTNKVFQAELFARHAVASPRTVVVHAGNVDEVAREVGLPCVLKRPDSAFSQGVVRVATTEELRERVEAFLEDSELVIAQAFTPSAFDWRIGVLDRAPLYAARYHMASGHWQIIRPDGRGSRRYGKVEPVPLPEAPARAVALAVRAAGLIGDGLYGVDLKELDGRFVVMEVNDNPNIESGCEDGELGDGLYLRVLESFRRRLDARGGESRAA
jgi:glutathione synthase/RimK-type ligase-like ATP-grasp enzyme